MSAPNNARLVAELQAVTLGITLVGLDRLPEVMRDGAAPAQTQDIATMTDTNTVHGGAVETDDLVDRFAAVLKEKLRAASEKYGYTNGWMRSDWRDDCIVALGRHVEKGDPRDVAAYCAFMWHHGWPTALHPTPQTDTDAREKVVECSVPPRGWSCSRPSGHEGPCAASSTMADFAGKLSRLNEFHRTECRYNHWSARVRDEGCDCGLTGAILAALKTGDA